MCSAFRSTLRLLSTPHPTYPFSKAAIVVPSPSPSPSPPPAKGLQHGKGLLHGKGLMAHLHKTLLPPHKQEILQTLFSKRHPKRIPIGSVLTVMLEHAPMMFTGVLMAIRRRGSDTSFLLRNVIQGVGVEMQFHVGSPHLKDVKVVRRAGERSGKMMRRAKLYYLRTSPDKMVAIASGQKA